MPFLAAGKKHRKLISTTAAPSIRSTGGSGMHSKRRNALPGFGLTLGYTVTYLSLIALIPLATLPLKAAGMGWLSFWSAVTSPRVIAAFELSVGASFAGAAFDAVIGVLVAWTLVRYRLPGKDVIESVVDLPFALPTSVAGIALTSIYSENGWLGRLAAPLGVRI